MFLLINVGSLKFPNEKKFFCWRCFTVWWKINWLANTKWTVSFMRQRELEFYFSLILKSGLNLLKYLGVLRSILVLFEIFELSPDSLFFTRLVEQKRVGWRSTSCTTHLLQIIIVDIYTKGVCWGLAIFTWVSVYLVYNFIK